MKYLATIIVEDSDAEEMFSSERPTDLDTPKEVLNFLCQEFEIEDIDSVCNIILLKNGAEHPEVYRSWTAEDWDDEEEDDDIEEVHGDG